MTRFASLFAALALAAALLSNAAQAHAIPLSTKVDNGAVMLRLNGRVDAARSRLTLLDAEGKEIRKLEIAAGEDAATLKAPLGDIAPGAYQLRWEVLSVDGHVSRGVEKLSVPAP